MANDKLHVVDSESYICANGHHLAFVTETSKIVKLGNYCGQCGSLVIHCCPVCNHPTFSVRVFNRATGLDNTKPENACRNCGELFPWVKDNIETAMRIVREDAALSTEEKDEMKDLLTNSIAEGPNTAIKASRLKQLTHKVGKVTVDAVEHCIAAIACQAFKTLTGL